MNEAYNKPVNTVALIGKFRSADVSEPLLALAAYLRQKGIKVLVEEGTATSIEAVRSQADAVLAYPDLGAQADVAIVVGGDGTMLDAARRLAEHDVPLVGVNVGRVGFMTDLSRDEMRPGVDALLAGQLLVERRFMLQASVTRNGQVLRTELALNDVVLNRGEIGRMIELELKVDGEFLYVLRADGLIIATPTGSTAYALSANGPILHPSVPGIAIVPLCPHALSNRPITIGDHNVVEMTLLPPNEALVHFDGQSMLVIAAGDTIRVERAPYTLTLLHPASYSYFSMLRDKLHWSAVPRGS